MGFEVTVKPLMQLTGTPPSPREAHLMVPLDTHRILVFGGGSICPASGPQQFNDMYLLDLRENKWSSITCKGEQPSPRTGQTATLLDDGRVLFFGGSSMLDGYMHDLYMLDTKEWVWSIPEAKGSPPSARDKHTACLFGRKLYVFGGFGPSTDSEHEHGEGSDVEEQQAHNQNDAMSEDEAEVEGEGEAEDEEDDEEVPCVSFKWYNDMHVLDVDCMEWKTMETKGNMPTPRAAHAAFISSSKGETGSARMVIFGGRDTVGRQNDLYTMDMQTLEWTKHECSKCPPARSFHSMVPVNDPHAKFQFAVCYGGVGVDGELFPGMEMLNLSTMEWASLNSKTGAWPPQRGVSSMVSSMNIEEPQLIIFGGSCSVEEKEPIYYNDAYSVDVSRISD